MRPNEITQREILSAAIADLLWKVGDKRQAILAIPGPSPVFEPSVRFGIDGVTEKLHLFKCTKEEELKMNLKKHIYFVSIKHLIFKNVFNVFKFLLHSILFIISHQRCFERGFIILKCVSFNHKRITRASKHIFLSSAFIST